MTNVGLNMLGKFIVLLNSSYLTGRSVALIVIWLSLRKGSFLSGTGANTRIALNRRSQAFPTLRESAPFLGQGIGTLMNVNAISRQS